MITLHTLPDASLRDIFDQAKNHLLTQGCRAVNEEGGCFYRGPNGTKCAVGCFISDEEYSPEMEEKDLETAYRLGIKDTQANLSSAKNRLLFDLQLMHDKHEPKEWPAYLDYIEKQHLDSVKS